MITLFRLYITYTKRHPFTGKIYVGKASALVDAITEKNIEKIRKRRENAPHHRNKDGFSPAIVDKVSTNKSAIRGREQLMYEHFKQGIAAKQNNPVGSRNPKKAEYLKTALAVFGDVAVGLLIYFQC